MHKIIAKNTLFQLITRSTSSAAGFVSAIILAGALHVAGYGDFILITTLVGITYLILDFGFNAIVLQHDLTSKHFTTLFYFRLLVSLVFIVAVNVLGFLFQHLGNDWQFRLGLLIFSLSIPFEAIQLSCLAIFQKNLRFDLFMWANTIGTLVTLGLFFIAAFLSLPLPSFLLIYVFGSFLTAGFCLKFVGKPLPQFGIDTTFLKKLIVESLPLGMMLVFNLIYFRVDILLLSAFTSSDEVGIYGFAYKFFDFLIALPLFLSNSLYPFMLKRQKINSNTEEFVWHYLWMSILISFIVLIASWSLYPLVILFRSEFLASIIPFRLLVLSLPLFFATSILQWMLIAKKQQQYLLFVYLFSMTVNIILNVMFIPHFSYIASAIITDVSELLVLILLLGYFFPLKKFIQHE